MREDEYTDWLRKQAAFYKAKAFDLGLIVVLFFFTAGPFVLTLFLSGK